MQEIKDPVYEFASLTDYGWKDRMLIRLADLVFFAAIKLTALTTQIEVRGAEHLTELEAAGRIPIFAVWHEHIFLGTYVLRDRGVVVMTSRSFDGEYIARFIQRFGFGAVRGSSSRGGSGALVEMVRAMRRGLPTAFTVDGPRGPRREAKPGAVMLAKKTGQPIVPFALVSQDPWHVRSWDRMQIPKPFSRAVFLIGPPIDVGADDDIDAKLTELQMALDGLLKIGEAWRSER